jgi:predicted nucleotidyltransferase
MAVDLDAEERTALADEVLRCLRNAVPGSAAELRGSLANGTADEYSDIDILWEVPDDAVSSCVEVLRGHLAGLRPLASLRSAPDFQRSAKRRLIFAHFAGVPLFWRVDIEVFAESIRRDGAYDLENEAARGDDWSLAHSALMNGIAAVKALLRGNEEEAAGLLDRGFARIERPRPIAPLRRQVVALAQAVVEVDPEQAGLARQVTGLCREAFAHPGP